MGTRVVGVILMLSVIGCGGSSSDSPGPVASTGGAGGGGSGGGGSGGSQGGKGGSTSAGAGGAGGAMVVEPTCSPGSVPGPQGACIPVGVRSCAAVFVDADGRCRPSASKCAPGTMPQFDTGCVPVGIAGCPAAFMGADGICRPTVESCPAGTLPVASKGCLPVGVTSCAPAFLGKDGQCHATQAQCAAGTFATPKGGCVPIDGMGCGSGAFGNVADAPGTVYVDGSFVGSSDGSKAKPFPTVAAALATSPARVVIAAGTYAEPLVIGKSVEVVGRCASMVTLTGTAPLSDGTPAIASIQGTSNVALRGLTLAGAGIGVAVGKSTGVTLDHLHVKGKWAGIYVYGDAKATTSIDHCFVDATASAPDGTTGEGIEADDGVVTVTSSALVGNSDVALLASGTGNIVASDLLVENTKARKSDQTNGYGVAAYSATAQVTLSDSTVVGSQTVGMFANVGTLNATNVLVEKTSAPTGQPDLGYGISAQSKAKLALKAVTILDSRNIGVFAVAGATATLDAVLVQRTVKGSANQGAGILANGAKIDMHGVAVTDVVWAAISSGMASTMTGEDIVVQRVVNAPGGAGATSLFASGKSTLTASRAALLHVDGANVGAIDVGSSVVLSSSLLEESSALSNSIAVALGGTVDASSTLVRESLRGGVNVGKGGTLTGKRLLIVGATSTPNSHGLEVHDGGKADLSALAIEKAGGVALIAGGSGTTVSVAGLVVESTAPDDKGTFGRGVEAQGMSTVNLSDAFITDCWNGGVFGVGGADVTITGALVEKTHSEKASGNWGVGMWLESSSATLSQVSFLANHEIALMVGTSSKATVTGCELAGTLPEEGDKLFGMGVGAVQQGSLQMSGSVVHDNLCMGAAVWNSTAVLSDTLIERTAAGKALLGGTPFDQTGDGFLATQGSKVTLTGVVSRQNQRAGFVVSDTTGTIASSTSVANGYGIVLLGTSQPQLSSDNAFLGNTTMSTSGGDLPIPSAPVAVPSPGG